MYNKQIDGLRGVLFLAVFSYHHDVSLWILTYALPCFFVLSGFLITRILLQADDQDKKKFFKAFYARRALRILPIYYIVIAVTWYFDLLLYPWWQLFHGFNIKLFIASLDTSTTDMVTVFGNWEYGQVHLWSMGIEEQFYLLWPFTLVFCKKALRLPLIAALIAASIASRFWFQAYYPDTLHGAILPVCGEYILWGCGAAVYFRNGYHWGSPTIPLYSGIISLAILAQMPWPHMKTGFFQFIPAHSQTFFAIALTLMIIGLWYDHDALFSRFLRNPVLAYIGKLSYGLYLMHMAMWNLGDWLLAQYPVLANINEFFLRLALCMAIGSLSWFAIEAPINRLKSRFPMPRREAA